MFQRLYTVALNTFVETIRQPIYGVILLATAEAVKKVEKMFSVRLEFF